MDIHSKQSGLTLVETMIALTLSLLLLAGVLRIFIANKQTYKVQDAMARVQEDGRFALHFLSDDVRMAGFMGCTSVNGGLNVTNNVQVSGHGNTNYNGSTDTVIQGFDGTSALLGFSYTSGTLPTTPIDLSAMGLTGDGVVGGTFGAVMKNTDILFIRRTTSCEGSNVTSTVTNSAQIQIADNTDCNIQQNDIVMVSDCKNADIFGVSNQTTSGPSNIAHGSNWNLTPQLANGYGPDARIYRMLADVYYIGVGKSGQPALFKRSLILGQMSSKELVEGVENMTILYGEDTSSPTDGIPDIYTTAGSVTDFENVISVRINVTARTLEDNVATSVSGSGDRRIRRSFTTTIGIRNRMS